MNNKMNLVMMSVGTAACIFALVAPADIKNPVTKPLRLHATVTWIVDLSDGSAVAFQTGEATHAGRITAEGSGTWDVSSFTLLSHCGTVTTATGGKIFWQSPGSSYHNEFTGGTGRWSDVTGGFTTVWRSEPDITPGPVPGTIVVTIRYRGEGTITY